MDLRLYVDNIHHHFTSAAEASGEDGRAVAERLFEPIDAAIRLALQDLLTAAADEITCELAPGSVELRLRGRNPEFVVTRPPVDAVVYDVAASADVPPRPSGDADEAAMSRINLRMPDHIKARVERAATGDGVSVNTWLVRAASAALERADSNRRSESSAPRSAQRYTGWAR